MDDFSCDDMPPWARTTAGLRSHIQWLLAEIDHDEWQYGYSDDAGDFERAEKYRGYVEELEQLLIPALEELTKRMRVPK